MDDKKVVIGDRTKFTLTAMIAFIGVGSWLTTMHIQGQANAAEISDIKMRLERIERISSDVSAIRQKLEDLDKKVDRL